MGLIASNRYVTMIEDEVRSLGAAAQPVRTLASSFRAEFGPNYVPPVYEIALHFWLRWTAWNFEYLRIPAIAFFLVGLFFLGRAAHRFSGPTGASAAIWFGILWPFGFHYGRLAAPYSFVFFLIAGLTFAYLRFLEKDNFRRWAALFLFGAALLWTNFLGWAVLACLAIDQALRRRAGERTVPLAVMARTAILWLAAFIPVMRASYGEFKADIHIHQSFFSFLTSCALSVYDLFVSESVAPWHWQLSVPAGLAVLVCVALVSMHETGPSRRFLFYAAGLLIFMAATGMLASDRLFFVAPWVLFPIAVGIGSIQSRWARPSLAAALLFIGATGWFGIYTRRYYSAPQFLEPWAQLAGDAAAKIQTGATLVSNSSPFFLYLTYAIRSPANNSGTVFEGLLPDTIHRSNVMSADQWLSAGQSMAPTMLWIRGAGESAADAAMDRAASELDHVCGSRVSRLMVRNPGFAWKQRFLPKTSGAQWRIEVRELEDVQSYSRTSMRHCALAAWGKNRCFQANPGSRAIRRDTREPQWWSSSPAARSIAASVARPLCPRIHIIVGDRD